MIRFDLMHIRTFPTGILQFAQAALSLIVLICVGSCTCNFGAGGTGFIYFVAIFGFFASLALLAVYSFHIPETIANIPWVLVGLGYTAAWTVFYFISLCIAASISSNNSWITNAGNTTSAMGATAFFSFLAMVAYGAEAFFYFRGFRTGQNPGSSAGGAPPSTTPTGQIPTPTQY